MALTIQWLGAAGLVIFFEGATLLVDPFFTRPSKRDLVLLRRVAIDRALVERFAPRAGYLLVTHTHYDHVMDVPEIARRSGAVVYGPPNIVPLMGLYKLPEHQSHPLAPGDRLELGPFSVEVYLGHHTPTPIDRLISGELRPGLRLPLRLVDYRMDACYSYRISAGAKTLLVGSQPVQADVLFLIPFLNKAQLAELLAAVRPQQVVINHWDDFTLPLSRPVRPMLITPAQGLPRRSPFAGRFDPHAFAEAAAAASVRRMEVIIPERFHTLTVQ